MKEEFDQREYDDLCHWERKRISQLPINEQYTQQFVYRGKTYFYDPDYDCFYAITPWEEMTYWDKYGWLWATAVLSLICVYLSYYK